MASEVNNFVNDTLKQCLYVYDATFTIKLVIDVFSDLLWTERYYGYSEFEVTMPMNKDIIDQCKLDDYISVSWSDKFMVIETIAVHTDMEQGDTLTISGRSLESILDRRISLDEKIGTFQTDGSPNQIGLQYAVKTLINNNIINPADLERRIPNFSYKDSTDRNVTELTIDSFRDIGANLYDKISAICKESELGFRVNPMGAGGFEFELYAGTDRSWSQDSLFAVVFSDSYDNLPNSDYLESTTNYRNVCYTVWDWKYTIHIQTETFSFDIPRSGRRVTKSSIQSSSTGLNRREVYNNDDSGEHDVEKESNIPTYAKQFENNGLEILGEHDIDKMFEGDVEYNRQFVYGVDYFLGDIVQLENKYGQEGRCRVTEVVLGWDASGPILTPTFELIEKGSD